MVLSVADIRFAYPGGRRLLDRVSFALEPGEALCLLGPNGTGKTTLIRCLLGLERVAAGRVALHGRDLARMSPAESARLMAYVPQDTNAAFAFLAFEVVLMGRSPHLRFMASPTDEDRRLARAAMLRLGIAHLAERPFLELSGGERQLVLVARALAQGSTILIMDEPCAGLDLANQLRIIRTIRALAEDGYSILFTTHLPDHAFAFAVGGKVAMLKDGTLMGPAAPDSLLDAEALGQLYGTPVEVVRIAQGRAEGQTLCVPVMQERDGR
ncbi:MAG: ABC transporter ATP-binding protein [Alphaproteobacteria bacterium]|nr:ABC transporter ATP-binding protein [Alphaproteobacteria bacterium]